MSKPQMTATTPIAWKDIETTGTEQERHTILSIGIARSDGADREWYVQPTDEDLEIASPEALAINGYSRDLWERRGARPAAEVAREVATFVDGHILGAHNAPFDVPFMRIWCRRYGVALSVPHRALCTVSLVWPLVLAGAIESPSHENICRYFGISLEDHHDALADARRARRIYEAVLAGARVTKKDY